MNYSEFLKKYLKYIEDNNQMPIASLKSVPIAVIKKEASFKLDIKSVKLIEERSKEVSFGYKGE